jgi:hypothetical protein
MEDCGLGEEVIGKVSTSAEQNQLLRAPLAICVA